MPMRGRVLSLRAGATRRLFFLRNVHGRARFGVEARATKVQRRTLPELTGHT